MTDQQQKEIEHDYLLISLMQDVRKIGAAHRNKQLIRNDYIEMELARDCLSKILDGEYQ